jgi:putative transcriptional regulator
LLICEPDKVAARKPPRTAEATADTGPRVTPRLGRHRSLPPA